ncbi:MAG: hypothetical protein HY898_16565 [Deltaproteobacteria bacterium]|nr:hypothetical protein [Deltaproteobacteria bacterium]
MRRLFGLGACALLVFGCSSSDSSGAAGGGTGGSGGTAEAGPDVTPDQVVADTAPDKADTGKDAKACEPQSVSGWTASWKPPSGKYQGKCKAGETVALMEACFGANATESGCAAAETQYADCNTCLYTDDTASQWGPVVYFSGVELYDRNEGGCFALLMGDTSATGCGAKLNAAYDCGIASCGGVCPTSTDAEYEAFNNCIASAAADAAFCKTYQDAADACATAALAADGGEALNACVWGDSEDWLVVAERIGEIFCGVEPSDGGADSGNPPVDAAAE